MTQMPNDLRVRRTRKMLHDALIELLSKRSFENITVGDLAEHAMINRATFYRHYQDKYALVENIYEEASHKLNTAIGPPERGLNDIDAEHTPDPWIAFFEHIAANTRLYQALLGKNGSSWFVQRMRDHVVKIMDEREQLRVRLHGTRRRPEVMPRKIAIVFAANLLIGTLIWWLESEEHYSPREVATWFRHFLFSGYPHALGFGPKS